MHDNAVQVVNLIGHLFWRERLVDGLVHEGFHVERLGVLDSLLDLPAERIEPLYCHDKDSRGLVNRSSFCRVLF
jgi:hypothetical protein